MDYNAIETQGVEITAEKEDKRMKISKGLKKAGKIALAIGGIAGAFLLGKKLGSGSDETECGYEEFDPEIDNVESDVSNEE